MLSNYQTQFVLQKQLTPDVHLFRFKLTEPKELFFSAGQYMIIEIPQPDKTVKKRFISIASPQQNKSEFEGVMKIIPGGVASTFLLGLKEGDQVHFQGPAGMFTFQNNNRQNIFIATGTGIEPIRSIIKSQFPNKFQISNSKWKSYKLQTTNYKLRILSLRRKRGGRFPTTISSHKGRSARPSPQRTLHIKYDFRG